MDGFWVCERKDAGVEDDRSLTTYDVILKIVVRDPSRLWEGAAARLRSGGLDRDDVDETIGSIDDPSIDDCLSTIVLPHLGDGCDLIDFDIQPGRPGHGHGHGIGDRLRSVDTLSRRNH